MKAFFEFAKFRINKRKKQISVWLFDNNKHKLKTELYHFNYLVTTRNDTYFYNLDPGKKNLNWKIILPVLN